MKSLLPEFLEELACHEVNKHNYEKKEREKKTMLYILERTDYSYGYYTKF